MASLHAVGAGLTPKHESIPNISMKREEVDIYLFPSLAVVEASFWMENHGEETFIEVGFPCFGSQGDFKPTDAVLQDFRATVNQEEVQHAETKRENSYYPLWRAWRQHFKANDVTLIKVSYWVPLLGYSGVSRMPFSYILRTGRFWKGRIGEAIIRVHAIDVPLRAIREAVPEGYSIDRDSKRIVWTLRDFYPEQDIGLLISFSDIQAEHLRPPDKPKIELDDVLELNESRPAAGTKVLFLSNARFPGDGPAYPLMFQKARFLSERFWDNNTSIPGGIRAFDRWDSEADEDITSMNCVVAADATQQEMSLYLKPGEQLGGWGKYLVAGHTAYNGSELYIQAIRTVKVFYGGYLPHPSLKSRFPWVSGKIEWPDHLKEQTLWPRTPPTTPTIRAKVPHR